MNARIFHLIWTCTCLILSITTSAQVPGCTDPAACNFNVSATEDDGTCTFPQWYIPVDFSGTQPAIQSCTAISGFLLADQSCAEAVITNDPFCTVTDWDLLCQNAYNACAFGCESPGCNNPAALNFNPSAGCDDGSCIIINECGNTVDTNGTGIDFTGYFAPQNWTSDVGLGDGVSSVVALSANITGNNNGTPGVQTVISALVPVDGTISFDWTYSSTDDNAQFDPAFVIANGTQSNLVTVPGPVDQSGSFSFEGIAGSTIVIGILSTDGQLGAATIEITNFRYKGTCILGCTDPTACNFQITANADDGSCIDSGCTDPTACNFDPNAACDDGSCTTPGCNDPAACNFDPLAGCDDGSCIFGAGCTDPTACNFDPAAICDDGSCLTPPVNDICANAIDWGTLDQGGGISFTQTYNNDNTCLDENLTCEGVGTTGLLGGGEISFPYENTFTNDVWFSFVANGGRVRMSLSVLNAAPGSVFPHLAVHDDCANPPLFCGGILNSEICFCEVGYLLDIPCGSLTDGQTYFVRAGGNSIGDPDDTGDFTIEITQFSNSGNGCTNPEACNFDPLAICEDGSCIFGACTNPIACNFDPAAICDDGSCVIPPVNDICTNAIDWGSGDANGALSFTQSLNNDNTCIDDPISCDGVRIQQSPGGIQTFPFENDFTNDIWFSFVANGAEVNINIPFLGAPTGSILPSIAVHDDCTNPPLICGGPTFSTFCLCTVNYSVTIPCGMLTGGQTYYVRIGGNNEGDPNATGNFTIIFNQDSNAAIGCTDPTACNFDPAADSCNELCVYPGCTDPSACNFDPNACEFNELCLYTDCAGNCGGTAINDECGNCVPNLYFGSETRFEIPGSYEYIVPQGIFELEFELYGAMGENAIENSINASGTFTEIALGGLGGMARGRVSTSPGSIFYVYVGSNGDDQGNPPFNGGGTTTSGSPSNGTNGGGATDVRLSPDDLFSRIIVAGGGGGGNTEAFASEYSGGDGGGLLGQAGFGNASSGGSQTTGGTNDGSVSGTFGIGGNGFAAGGGGWYGGGAGNNAGTGLNPGAGGGGSSYIDGVEDGQTLTGVHHGQGLAIVRALIQINPGCVGGCDDPTASNFNPDADFNDGSCEYFGGCTYSDATNFDPAALVDDGSCVFDSTPSCNTDLNGDGVMSTGDLVILLAVFGSTCP